MENKNYYEDIPDDQFVPLECVNNEFLGLYEINKLGQIKTKSSGLIRSVFNKTKEGYPYVTLTSTDRVKKSIARIHILLAKTFIPNPDNKPVVDHISRERDNFSLSNIRWASYSENSQNRKPNDRNRYAYVKCDSDGNEIERVLLKDLDKKESRRIRDSITYKHKYKSYFWKRVDLDVEEYILKYGNPIPDGWKQCSRILEYECNLNGLFRNKETGKLIMGCNQGGYIVIKHNKKQYMAHRLIYETFSGETLSANDVIDHLNTDSCDNRFSNLRAGSQSDNLSNPITVEKKSKRILRFSYDGKLIREYSSVKEASLELLGKESGFRFSHCRYSFGSLWCYKGEEDTIKEKVNSMIFKYNNKFEIVDVFVTINSASSNFNSENLSYFFIKKYIDTGKLAPDNCYYFHGPHNFDNEDE